MISNKLKSHYSLHPKKEKEKRSHYSQIKANEKNPIMKEELSYQLCDVVDNAKRP